MRERHRVLHEANFDTASRGHLVTDDPRRLFTSLLGIGANQSHRVNVGAAEAALPVFRRVQPDIAHYRSTAAHTDPERLGEAVQRSPREPERLQALVGEADIDGETCPMLFRPRR